ncbi:MAG: rRNA pseudouridine synthase [Lachnospiraceae bacterium]|nr:rRNA pseudouridine synthase [Lachnospiraceae bacterium]
MQTTKTIRLDKALCDIGYGTRSEVKKMITHGRVKIDGVVVKSADLKIDMSSRTLQIDGAEVFYNMYEYRMLNKPAGVISATEDPRQKTVLDLVRGLGVRKDLAPVGRLDIDTEGLLLLTNDGALTHRLLSPKKHVPKTYFTRLDAAVTDDVIRELEAGVDIDDADGNFTALPAKIERTASEDEVYITIYEGKYHQVKRMFAKFGLTVVYLKRISMGSLSLDETLKPGESRFLTKEEIDRLKAEV